MPFDAISTNATFKDNLTTDQVPDSGATITFCRAENSNAPVWRARTEPLSEFIASLTAHDIARRENGLSAVLADLVEGQRTKTAVKSVTGLALDVTTGVPTDVIVAALKAFGHHAVVYTAFDHGRTETRFSKDGVTNWLSRRGHPVVDQQGVQRFLCEGEGWHDAILKTAAYIGDDQTSEGLMARVQHAPFPAHRIVFPLAEPFVPTTAAASHADGIKTWGNVVRAIARALSLPDKLSRDAVDPARFVHLPRRRNGAEASAVVIDGTALNWREMDLTPPVKSPTGPTFESIQAVIAAGVENPAPVLERIATLEKGSERDTLLKALSKATGASVVVMRNEVNAARKAAPEDVQGVVRMDGGHRVLVYSGGVDQVEARGFILDTMKAANEGGEPNFTLNLGSIMAMRRHGGTVTFEAVTPEGFKGEMAKRCSFAAHRDGGELIRDLPDKDICRAVYEALDPDALPTQPAVRRAPTVGADGRLLDRNGWHGDVLVDLGGLKVPPVPLEPTPREIAQARKLILEDVLGDFPFDDGDHHGGKGESRASRANAVAMLLTPFARDLFDGPAPVFGIIKPTAGTGGTLLATVPQILFDGRAAMTTPNTSSEEEMQKVLVAAAQGDSSFMFFDNVRAFDSPTILRTTTSPYIGGRILGLSKNVERKNDFMWTFTGNNPRMGGEMARRTCFINLNSRTADNATRTYQHDDYESWLGEKRGEVIAALLTLIRAWIAKGRTPGAATLASFTSWAGVVGGVLTAAEITGFLDNKRAARADREGAEIKDFVSAWWERHLDGEVDDAAAFTLADGRDSGLITGFGSERRQNFLTTLDGLRGRVFEIADAKVMLAVTDSGWRMVSLSGGAQ